MTEKELNRYAEQETSWLHYYGNRDLRQNDSYEDGNFYDRIVSIGHTKAIVPLDRRCPATYITAEVPVLQATIENLQEIGSPRNHQDNIYTPLEYVISNKIGRFYEFVNKLKS